MALKRLVCTSFLSAANTFSLSVPKRNPVPVIKETALVSVLFRSPRMCFSTDSKTNPILKDEDDYIAGEDPVMEEKARKIMAKLMKYFDICAEYGYYVDPGDIFEKKKIKFDQSGLQVTLPAPIFKKEDLTIEVRYLSLCVKGENIVGDSIDRIIYLPGYNSFNPREVTASIINDELIVKFPYGKEGLKTACFTVNKWVV